MLKIPSKVKKERIILQEKALKNIEIVLSLKKSESLGDIMDLRLYNYGKSRTNLRTNKWKKKDSLLLVLNILILSIVIFY